MASIHSLQSSNWSEQPEQVEDVENSLWKEVMDHTQCQAPRGRAYLEGLWVGMAKSYINFVSSSGNRYRLVSLVFGLIGFYCFNGFQRFSIEFSPSRYKNCLALQID